MQLDQITNDLANTKASWTAITVYAALLFIKSLASTRKVFKSVQTELFSLKYQ